MTSQYQNIMSGKIKTRTYSKKNTLPTKRTSRTEHKRTRSTQSVNETKTPNQKQHEKQPPKMYIATLVSK